MILFLSVPYSSFEYCLFKMQYCFLLQTEATETIGARETHVAVVAIAHGIQTAAQCDAISDIGTSLQLVALLRPQDLRRVQTIVHLPRILEIRGVFVLPAVEAHARVVRVLEVVPRRPFGFRTVVVLARHPCRKFGKLLTRFPDGTTAPSERRKPLVVLLF
jgi:hypothetical protein